MHWERNFEIKKDDKILGKVIYSSIEGYFEFYAEIIISDIIYLQKIKIENEFEPNAIIPSKTFTYKTETEMYENIVLELHKIFGQGFTLIPIA